jgi:hypothetical protein
MPILSTVIGLGIAAASAGSGIAGIVENKQAGDRQQKALTIQEQIAQQEQGDKQQIFKQLTDFFTPYLSSGSPFLQNIQRAGAENNATQANNAAGTFRQQIGSSGLGFGPSGSTAAGLAGIGSGAATSASGNYLYNLLNNEQIKFQAAQGLNSAGTMAGSPQNQPNVSAQLPFQSLGSGLTGLAGILKGLTGGGSGSSGVPNNLPTTFPSLPGVGGIGPSPGAPTTSGWNFGGPGEG